MVCPHSLHEVGRFADHEGSSTCKQRQLLHTNISTEYDQLFIARISVEILMVAKLEKVSDTA